ncbi:hypothetical protein C2G38_2227829 [Gigaspora rosea]|uniref:BED-type domain-containing protein n=1 Tax=Gigaspora rosea TaxID=44941 RepID=A0A397U0Y1_9GLOM|nr:hypothetical protein C2G38_2227829 [Gigaspora rosea]
MQSHISLETGKITINSKTESTQSLPGFTCPDMKIHDYQWIGFWRSLEKGAGNKYTAKCFHCSLELSGRPDRLYAHINICSSWPITDKSCYIKKASASASNPCKSKNLTPDKKQLTKKLKIMESFTDITIALDGWQDVSKILIYGFMSLKEDKEHILDIIDLSAN